LSVLVLTSLVLAACGPAAPAVPPTQPPAAAHDSALVREHPDWFHQDEHGAPVTTVPDWSDEIGPKPFYSDLLDYHIGPE